jgi:hypothetical protein
MGILIGMVARIAGLLPLLACFTTTTKGFLAQPVFLNPRKHETAFASSSLSVASSKLATLTDETTWDLRFLLQALPTENGKKVDEIFTVSAQFIEEEGYEPPQGYIRQAGLDPSNDDEDSPSRLRIVKSRWQLSEDPSDRKDGLWIWGLFKEPLYPFLILQLETDRIPVPGDDNDAIKPLKLYAQVDHKRDKEVGAILSGSELKVRETDRVKADPFGASFVEIYEEISVGNLQIKPKSSQ